MRLRITAVAFTSALSTTTTNAFMVARQTLTACYTNCLGTANLGGCTLEDYVCLCKSQPYIQSMWSCIYATCSSPDIALAKAYAQSICNSVGVSVAIPSTVTGVSTSYPGASPTGTVTGGPVSNGVSHPPVGAIAGGVVGGVAVLAAIAIILFIYNRKKREKVLAGPQSEVKPFDSSHDGHTESQMQSHSTLLSPPSEFNRTDTIPPNFSIQPFTLPPGFPDGTSSTTSEIRAAPMRLADDIPTIHSPAPPSSLGPSSETRTIAESPPQLMARSTSPSTTVSSGPLAVEQLVTLQTLYNLNMPPAEIAGVMERMRRAPEVGSGSGLMDTNGMRDPPSYDMPAAEIADETESAQGGEPHVSSRGSSGLVRGNLNIGREPPMYDFKDK